MGFALLFSVLSLFSGLIVRSGVGAIGLCYFYNVACGLLLQSTVHKCSYILYRAGELLENERETMQQERLTSFLLANMFV